MCSGYCNLPCAGRLRPCGRLPLGRFRLPTARRPVHRGPWQVAGCPRPVLQAGRFSPCKRPVGTPWQVAALARGGPWQVASCCIRPPAGCCPGPWQVVALWQVAGLPTSLPAQGFWAKYKNPIKFPAKIKPSGKIKNSPWQIDCAGKGLHHGNITLLLYPPMALCAGPHTPPPMPPPGPAGLLPQGCPAPPGPPAAWL